MIEAVAAGATGYLQTSYGLEELAGDVRDVAEGRLRVPDHAIRRVSWIVRGQREFTSRTALNPLTKLEREMLTTFASGRSYTQIAEARGNSPLIVRNAVYRIKGKVGVETKLELVIWAFQNGLLDGVKPGS